MKYKSPMKKIQLKLVVATAAAITAELFAPVFIGVAHAAPPPQLVSAFVRLDRHKALTATGGTICAKTNTLAQTPLLGSENDFQITFPTQGTGTDFVVNATATNWTVTTTNLPAGATAWPGIGTATAVSGKTVTFPSTALSASTLYCFNFVGTSTLTNGSSGNSLTGTIHTRTSGGSPAIINETNYATAIIADDQIVVSAVVPPNFIFSLGGNTDAFTSNLDPLNIISTTGVTFSVITNAKSGWIGWVKDSQQGLTSATAGYTIPTAGSVDGATTTLVANGATEGYVLDADIITDAVGGCTVGIDPEYDGPATSDGGTLSANFQPVAACTGIPPATSNGDTVKLIERATIAGGTPAGSDYTDIITVVAAGNF
jgi:hypothetical protein